MTKNPNILFIAIDALPAYRCYQKDKTALTPNIDFLIHEGIKFEQTISCADLTPVSFGSMFTGSFPFRTMIRGGLKVFKLKKNAINCIDILKKNSYKTVAMLPEISTMYGIYEPFEKESYDFFSERLHNGLTKRIIEKLKSKDLKQPWMYFVHLMDAHKPIFYPDKFEDEKYGKDEYDKMMSSVDFYLGKILENVNFENTLVILTADHGDFIKSIRRNDRVLSLEHKSLAGTVQTIGKYTPKFLYPLINWDVFF